jgi:Ca2+-binding RTX toxin-like protein
VELSEGGAVCFFVMASSTQSNIYVVERRAPRIGGVEFCPLEQRVLLSGWSPPADPSAFLAAGCTCPACLGLGMQAPVVAAFAQSAEGSAAQLLSSATGSAAFNLPLTSVPALNSRPGAAAKLYLNFTGAAPSRWGLFDVPTTPAYDRDGDPGTFSNSEIAAVQEIWARVAEKYSPFNIDVTTVNPGNTNNRETLQVVIGGNGQWSSSAGATHPGGMAYTGAFYTASFPNVVYVFSSNLSNGDPKSTAEVAAHEAGHAFGLAHQAVYNASGVQTAPLNTGNSDRAPLMGNSLSSQRGVWWIGPTTSATTIQDGLAILSGPQNGFGYRPDDHGNTPGAATPLTNVQGALSGAGVIERTSDLDYFSFSHPGGNVSFNINPAQQGPMLRLVAQLRDASNSLLASGTPAGLGASFNLNLPAGTYFLVVRSNGEYWDVGQYRISGQIPVPYLGEVRLVGRELQISGTDASDVLVIQRHPVNSGVFSVDLNGQQTQWQIASVDRIRMDMLGGNDLIRIEDSNGPILIERLAYLGGGNDSYFGTAGKDVVYSQSGNNLVYGGDGPDILYGGPGNDTLHGGNGRDWIHGWAGNNQIFGGQKGDTLIGGPGNDRIHGARGHDLIFGGAGNDWLDGGPGNDTMHGGPGFDTMFGGPGNDLMYGNENGDTMFGGPGNDTLYGGKGHDVISGDEEGMEVFLGAGALTGQTGNNYIFGAAGNDTLRAHGGRDTLAGGPGTDTFDIRGAQHVLVDRLPHEVVITQSAAVASSASAMTALSAPAQHQGITAMVRQNDVNDLEDDG